MRSGLKAVLAIVLLYGCTATAGDDRSAPDMFWRELMLTGYYGTWQNGKEVPPSRWDDKDKIHSHPDGASVSRYRLNVTTMNSWGNGEEHIGGLLARSPLAASTVELFGRLSTPIRLGGMSVERHEAFDLFLVIRPTPIALGRLVRQWHFAPNELLLTGDPVDPDMFRRSTRNEVERGVAPGSMGTYRFHFVDAYLDVDQPARTATVTVTGLKRAFVEHVDLTLHVTGALSAARSVVLGLSLLRRS